MNPLSNSSKTKPKAKIKTNGLNNIDLNEWRKYLGDITTDALWVEQKKKNDGKFIIPKRDLKRADPKRDFLRDFLPKNSSTFHGLFIPEIPYQFISRFTKKKEMVWDCFAGSGTTHKVAKILDRKCISNDLTPQEDFILKGDSTYFNPGGKVQLLIMHPPYHDIVKYSDKKECGSNCQNIEGFLEWFERVVRNCVPHLEDNRFLILVCGNIYHNSEEHTLGVWCKDIIRKQGFKLKSHIIKDYGETKGGAKNYNMQYYRQLKGNFNNFYGDNIFVMQKA